MKKAPIRLIKVDVETSGGGWVIHPDDLPVYGGAGYQGNRKLVLPEAAPPLCGEDAKRLLDQLKTGASEKEMDRRASFARERLSRMFTGSSK